MKKITFLVCLFCAQMVYSQGFVLDPHSGWGVNSVYISDPENNLNMVLIESALSINRSIDLQVGYVKSDKYVNGGPNVSLSLYLPKEGSEKFPVCPMLSVSYLGIKPNYTSVSIGIGLYSQIKATNTFSIYPYIGGGMSVINAGSKTMQNAQYNFSLSFSKRITTKSFIIFGPQAGYMEENTTIAASLGYVRKF